MGTTFFAVLASIASVGAVVVSGVAAYWSRQTAVLQAAVARHDVERQRLTDQHLAIQARQEKDRDSMWRALELATSTDTSTRQVGAALLREMSRSNRLDPDDEERLFAAGKALLQPPSA